MNKVKIKVSEKQISALVHSFNQAPKKPVKERIARVAKSVLDKVILKIKTRQLQVQQKATLFSSKEKHSISLDLVEAHFLEQFLVSMVSFPMSDYDRNVLNQITATINQQLA
ncbi:MAG: hypothetical protein REI96_06200 [Flavobacterium nitrogenifigens]|uniref:hypothetical protein n=1 Tax=Flavobacterium nitrogenifigens TaxID=1617283 RepID=UPI002808A386|nr:hypothetical protein [Flavobacterium nitrogenifigens]MDQ8012018.1 hypothetical protein [Flavobacterium nitrogenifigens]